MLSPSESLAPLALDPEPPKEHDRCLRCNRRLTNPIWRRRGYGEACDERGRYERIMGYAPPQTLTVADLRAALADTALDPHARIIIDDRDAGGVGSTYALANVKHHRLSVLLVVGPAFPPTPSGKPRAKRERKKP